MASMFFIGVMAGFWKAVRDTVSFHLRTSFFSLLETAHPAIYRWVRSYWTDRPGHPFFPIWDAWHFAETMAWLSGGIALAVGPGSVPGAAAFLVGLGLSFQVCFHWLFLLPENRHYSLLLLRQAVSKRGRRRNKA